MRCCTPQIVWHNKEPVLSIDVDPNTNYNSEASYIRIVTGGSDNHVLVWHLKDETTIKPSLTCVAELTRHAKAVNVVRFNHEGNLIATADDDAFIFIWKYEKTTKVEDQRFEHWSMDKTLRKHLEDITDVSWSKDSSYLASASVDNSVVLWDVKKNASLCVFGEQDHGGYVQGVAFDPLSEFIATMSIDRTLRMYSTKSPYKLVKKALKYPSSWLSPDRQNNKTSEDSIIEEDGNEKEPVKKKFDNTPNRLFHDDMLRTFVRRLEFSPKGEFLMVPGGLLPPQYLKKKENNDKSPSISPKKENTNNEGTKDQGRKRKLITSIAPQQDDEVTSSNHAVVVFCRNNWQTPCSVIPTGSSFPVVIKFCPVYFERKFTPIDKSLINSQKKSERMISCVGNIQPTKESPVPMLDMPYRLVYAIATNNSIIIGDTISQRFLARIRNIHFARITDLNWSSDGRILIASSNDGYCTIVTFDKGELGSPINQENLVTPPPTAFPVLPPPIPESKPKKQKEPKAPVEKKPKKEKEPKPPKVKAEKKKATPKPKPQPPQLKNVQNIDQFLTKKRIMTTFTPFNSS